MSGCTLSRRQMVAGLLVSPAIASVPAFAYSSDFHDWAPTPPMGWNSWDSFGPTITEAEARANAKIMADVLKPHGYKFFTVDIQWYEPGANSYTYRKGAKLAMDKWGRLIPAVNRFPSATGDKGFKPLADYVHSLGLKFAIHLMRGVPRQAVEANTPILGTPYHASDIADKVNVCEWNTDMYGIDMSKPGAQAYYNSIFKMYAEWGVDFVKVDDMSRPYIRNEPEIEAVRKAIDATRRPIVLSLSPGETTLDAADHVTRHANMWRISDDFWDHWPALKEQFGRLDHWWQLPHVAGCWPDADMLPLGVLDLGKRKTNFTPDEQKTMMSLWAIARSPLIMGGDLRKLDPSTEALLTNDAVLRVNQHSTGNHALFTYNDAAAWIADDGMGGRYVGLFNLSDHKARVAVPTESLEGLDNFNMYDLWAGQPVAGTNVAAIIPPHGAELYRLTRA